MSVSVQAVFYGDHPQLARRLLSSWKTTDWDRVDCVRLGLNAVSPATKAVIASFAGAWPISSERVFCYDAPDNPGKYPLWRKMLASVEAEYSCWFDDDVAVRDVDAWRAVFARILERKPIAAGNPQLIDPVGRQFDGFAAQPWYAGKPWYYDARPGRMRDRIWFLTGKHLIVQNRFIRTWDFPFPQLHHCGGDTSLGELLRQQDADVLSGIDGVKFKDLVDYNDPPRRGIDEPRLWRDWPKRPLTQPPFRVRVTPPEGLFDEFKED